MSRFPVPSPDRVRSALESVVGQRAVVVGAGASGLAAAELLARLGARVTVVDDRPQAELTGAATRLGELKATVHGGGIAAASLVDAQLVVVSPGVPLTKPALVEACEAGALLISEVDLALSQLELPLVAVTGTNGKSTTTTMIGALLEAAGQRPFVGGNLGTPLCAAVTKTGEFGCAVLELSSYQLELTSLLAPRVAVVTNLAPDHLDRYPDAEAYFDAKRRVYASLPWGGCLVARDRELRANLLRAPAGAELLCFGADAVERGARVGSAVVEVRRDALHEQFDVENPRIRGQHNRENLAAAVLAALAMGAAPEQIRTGIAAYAGIAHRLESVASVAGVLYVNDSKGTNVDATVKALESFSEPVLLIAGGRDKGTGYAELAQAARGRVRTLLTIGESGPLIDAALADAVDERVAAGTLERAVSEAAARARADEVVLLSPACASFDQFANFEARGRAFVTAVQALQGDRA